MRYNSMFNTLKQQVQQKFNQLQQHDLFIVDLQKDELFDVYINAIPEQEQQEYRCHCCRHFLNNYGGIIAIVNNQVLTLWDFDMPAPYNKIPTGMKNLVLSKSITGPFLSKIQKLGTDFNHQRLTDGTVIKWEHFYTELSKNKVIKSKDSIETINSQIQSTRQVFERSLQTITVDAITTVLDLIKDNALYRGKEFEAQLKQFLNHKINYDKLTPEDQKQYTWLNYTTGGRIRNTAIGTLLIDLSEGKDLEVAVKSFENIVAPANYKRPTALITNKMIEQAQNTIEELGITQSLKRRHATKDDIPVSHVLYVNRDKPQLSVFDELKQEVTVSPDKLKNVKNISLTEFIDNIVPTATNIELLLQNNTNFVSLIAPEDSESPNIFNWDNKISWTYQNNMTDTIKEKVKQAGGSVTGELRVSLEWFNYDDLDINIIEPNGNKIYYGKKRSKHSDGYLDVDMNAGGGTSRTPVENIIFKDTNKLQPGKYLVNVHNFSKREHNNVGFNVQIECRDQVIDISHPKSIANHKEILVATFKYDKQNGLTEFTTDLDNNVSQKQINNVFTNRFNKVNMIMYSPNHWTNNVGNKHLFLILDDAKIDTPLRTFFNEYLNSSLQTHRKVFEVLAGKLMIPPSDQQLTGVGFSLTQQQSFIVKVNDKLFNVNI